MMNQFDKLVNRISTLLEITAKNYNEIEVKDGLCECAIGIRRINKAIKNSKLVSKKQKLLSTLRNIKSLRSQLKLTQKRSTGVSVKETTAKHRVHWEDTISAFNSRIRTGTINNLKHKDSQEFLTDCKTVFKRRIHMVLKKYEAVKVNAVFGGQFQTTKGDRILNEFKYFNTANAPIYRNTDITEWFDKKITRPILTDLEEFQERDSGWTLKQIINLGVNINKFTPQLGSSYIPLPPYIASKKACINVKNKDNACFAWSVVSALHQVNYKDHPYRTSSYPHYSKVLKLKGIQFPMTMRQIPNFEKLNDVSINVYSLEKKKKIYKITPTLLTKHTKNRHVNLLLVQDKYFEDSSPIQYHYVWIKDLSRLLSKQLSRENGRKYFCDRCLHYFRSEEKLNNHIEDCQQINECAVKMPIEGGNILKFKNFKNKVKGPFVIYADLESILKPIDEKNKYQQHLPAAVGYYVKCSYDDSLSFYRSYRGQDCMSWFAAELQQFAENVETVFICQYDINMTPKQECEFQKETHCHICEKPFKPEDKRVRDHNHLIPENNYRGIAHDNCNINYKDEHTIPVIFHNLSGYDAHFIIADIASRMEGRIDLLPITKEKYISFTKHINESTIKFRFIDSFRFMNSSLDKLASYLNDFPNLKSQFPDISKEDFNILTKKAIMPYDYIDSVEKLEETSLPSIDQFYNKLNDKKCSRKLHSRAREVWNKFNCNNLGEYVDLYMKIDILLLVEVYEQFRNSCMETYGLDPSHYFTLPGFTWDCMLKHTNQELELLTDIDKFLFVERGIRGGLSQVCSKRRAHANNQYIPNYNTSKPDTYLMYYDVNNQYGWAMSQALPYGGFDWVSDINIDVTSIPDNSTEGYILEVDLQYPQLLHDIHKDLPFCPEHIDPKTGKPPATAAQMPKLMATLNSKQKYVIHYRALKQALKHGLKLTKIHRVLKFKQSAWLKTYIDLNTKHRTNAKNEFEKNLFKLMNNAVFGKTMENIRKRANIRLVTKWEGRYGAEALISKPEFKNCTIFNENLAAIELKKLQILLNKPIYVGMSVLDIAKLTIYDFHYDYMLANYQQYNLLYTDTDSLIYEIHNQDPYEIMKRDCKQYFDTSDYPEDNTYKIPRVNKKVLGKMTDENSGVPMTDYIGLRSKLYTIKSLATKDDIENLRKQLKEQDFDDDEIQEEILNYNNTKKAKGVKKSIVRTKITYEDFVECLENFREKSVNQNLIQSDKHKVHSITQQKTALSPYDDKRYLIPGTYETLPWGHYKINTTQSSMEAGKRKCISFDSVPGECKKSRTE